MARKTNYSAIDDFRSREHDQELAVLGNSHFTEESNGFEYNGSHSRSEYSFISSRRGIESDPEYQKAIAKSHSFWPLRRIIPIIVLVAQILMLASMIGFIIWTSVKYRVVPSALSTLYRDYPQFMPTIITLIGTVLSLVNTKLFAEAVRFTINVSLGNPESNGMSLYSFYAATVIGSRSFLFSFDKHRIHWTIMSLIYFALFVSQTAAWTTILTPKEISISIRSANTVTLMDYDFASPVFQEGTKVRLANLTLLTPWAQMASSGIASARQYSNVTQYFPYSGHVLNGTTRGTLPSPNISYAFKNWTRIEAIQQGLTANVNCTKTPSHDPALKIFKTDVFDDPEIPMTYTKVAACCNCTTPQDISDNDVFTSIIVADVDQTDYIAFTICPFWLKPIKEDFITVYMRSSVKLVGNLTCTIKPQYMDYNVTYNNGGLVTVQPIDQSETNIPVNVSGPIFTSMMDLLAHFRSAQSPINNNIADIWTELAFMEHAWPFDDDASIEQRMADYMRGAFELTSTSFRVPKLIAVEHNKSKPVERKAVPFKTYVPVVVWGQISLLKLLIIIVPLAIMSTTIIVVLVSMSRARSLGPEHAKFFNPMDMLHVMAACSTGNVQSVPFPDYRQDLGAFGKKVEIQLSEKQAGVAAGFHVHRRT